MANMRGDRIRLNIRDLDIFKSFNYKKDYLEIRDGYWHKSPLLGRFCGNKISDRIVSTGNRMYINYVSSHADHHGIAANYKALFENDNSHCYQILTDKNDEFSTPHYHNKSNNHISCWLLA